MRPSFAFALLMLGVSACGGGGGGAGGDGGATPPPGPTPAAPAAATGVITYATPTEEVHAFDVATGVDTKLTDGSEPDRLASGEIVFATELGLGQPFALSLAGADGSGAHEVAKPGSVTASLNPVGSPDGTRIAFTYYPRGFSHTFSPDDGVVVVDRGGAIVARLPGLFDPAWTPDGRLVASGTVHTPSGNANAEPTDTPKEAGLFVSAPDLAAATRIPVEVDHPMTPAVSADGKLVAFVQKDDVWVVGIDGSGLHQLTAGEQIDAAPTFSPDGASVALQSLGLFGNSFTTSAIAIVPVAAAAPLTLDGSSNVYVHDAAHLSDSVQGRIAASDHMRWR